MALTKVATAGPEDAHERAARLDEEDALEFGFEISSIREVRYDLATYVHMYDHDAFMLYHKMRRKFASIRKSFVKNIEWLDVELAQLSDLTRDKFEIIELNNNLSAVIQRLNAIESAIPGRASDMKNRVLRYLIASWAHEPIPNSYIGTSNIRMDKPSGLREIRLTFGSEKRRTLGHISMRFIRTMLERSDDMMLKSISNTSIRRVKSKLGAEIPTPGEISPFDGDDQLLDLYFSNN